MDAAPLDRDAFLKMASYPLVRQSDMSEETRLEAIDICTSGARAGRTLQCTPYLNLP